MLRNPNKGNLDDNLAESSKGSYGSKKAVANDDPTAYA
jgi:hypothetical protein